MKNDILNLKGSFDQRKNPGKPGSPKLAKNSIVSVKDIERLILYLEEMKRFWKIEKLLNGCLISVYYNTIIAKSNRCKFFLCNGSKSPNDTIVGAKFSDNKKKHIITHFIPYSAIENSIINAQYVINILNNEFNGSINDIYFNEKKNIECINCKSYNTSKSKFQKIIVDTSYIEKFDVERADFEINKSSIVTLYDTGTNTQELLEKLGIPIFNERILNKTTVLLDEQYLHTLLQKAPYLVAMAVENISELSPSDFSEPFEIDANLIPSPKNEPTIGVIDTLFDERVYFHEWVEFHNKIDVNIPTDADDYKHGTAVSSLIVDGPSINPHLDDGCGRFKVRHFGVATNRAFNSFTIIRTIKEIVAENRDIRVWNLSLGSNDEIKESFISAEGAVLDQIQFENDVIFVIAGTNNRDKDENRRIGAPADSINSIIVNSVDLNNIPADYSRRGIVLSFFTKPDVCYYGGTRDNYISVCEPLGESKVAGTSFAAPWIARKLSYLIDVIGLSKEIAKALIIDSAIGWENHKDFEELSLKGNGVVPIRIEDIIQSTEDEIKFVVEGVSEKYDTYKYSFPVPIYQNKHPYVAKATLCYFPKCSRNQGVDYTNTELDIYFGRIDDNGILKSINKNKQSIEDKEHYLFEEDARKLFRKWDNVKHISEPIKERSKGKKVYKNPMWGMSIKTKERLSNSDGEGIRFGVVVTLKEINGVNRIDDFIQQCHFKGWLVNRINVENRIDIYQTANEEITLE
ncbi:subtilase family protein [Breznakia blatticola]|uniref:Subtilase family protein n=1 Tax=Breznakia blatticola TaxID=1754012 RepID=A0A4R7ZCR6_9FIRM|nr:S8 family peptidase [Breznakia blatticola]TDW13191.1 subtilase family protein [Breznakia blatticola]